MRCSPSRSLTVALGSLALCVLPWTAPLPVHGQDKPAPKTPTPDAGFEKRAEKLEQTIAKQVNAGKIAEAVVPARELFELRKRNQADSHWQTVEARWQFETLQQLAAKPREAQQQYVKAAQAIKQGEEAYARGRYAEVRALFEEALEIHRRILGEENPDTGSSYFNLAVILKMQGKYAEAEAMLRQALAIQIKALGAEHPDIAMMYTNLARTLGFQGKHVEAEAANRKALAIHIKARGEDHRNTAAVYNNLAGTLENQEKYSEAEAVYRQAMAIFIKVLGAEHPETATCYTDFASTLAAQGKYAEAEALNRQALVIYIRALGAEHPNAANTRNNLALILELQGKYAEAETLHRQALAIHAKTVGADHPNAANTSNNLAQVLRQQGKYAEAEAMQRQALANYLKALGAEHAHTASSYSNLATTLQSQGKDAEAEALHRQSLAIILKARGADHPSVAASHANLALILRQQGKYAEAETIQRQALAAELKALGADNRSVAISCANLATTLEHQGKYAEAEAKHHQALAIHIKALGPEHPNTAISYNNLALTLKAQGKYREAEFAERQALSIRLKVLGADHPATLNSYNNLAVTLDLEGRSEEALRAWTSAAEGFELARLHGGFRGLESSLATDASLLPALALGLAGSQQPDAAWVRWEQGLARGILDETVGRGTRPLTLEDRKHEADLLGTSQALDEQIGRLKGRKTITQEGEKRIEELNRQASEVRRKLLELRQQFDTKYGALAGKPAMIGEVQNAIPEGTALVGWIDTLFRHGACVLKKHGDPVWVLLPGKGERGAWTKDEVGLTAKLRQALDPDTAQGDWKPLAEAVARQRIEPIRAHIKGVKRLIVVNSPGMAGVPVEALLATQGQTGMAVSYAPSASMFAYLVGKNSRADRPATLLALGDPAYPEPKPEPPAPTPPDQGLFISRVVPNGNADLNGFRAGDVLIEYAGNPLKTIKDLQPVAADAGPKKVPARYWRDGEMRSVELAAGPLGVALDKRPPAQVVLARQAAEKVLVGLRGGTWGRLPGTRREVEAIAALFPSQGVRRILGEEARESIVQGLAGAGKLRGFRFLHFASHGTTDPRNAYCSALILAPEPDRSADPLATFDTDGTITADQITRTWDLDADLVVLSACQSGLGRPTGGEGYLGFSQALFSKGARSLVLSLWKVDDDATALLMTRFYGNLLGKREGLKSPMPKAEALSEAKAWLRGLGKAEVDETLATLPRGTIVHREAVASKLATRPYENPTYWAGFILVGAPD